MSEDRAAFKNALGTLLAVASHNARALPGFAQKHAEELGLRYVGELEEKTEGPSIKFKRQVGLETLDWGDVETQLGKIGRIYALFAVPKQLLLGIRGVDGDVYLRMADIQVYRHQGVFQTIERLKDLEWP